MRKIKKNSPNNSSIKAIDRRNTLCHNLNPKMDTKRLFNKPSYPNAINDVKRERTFELSLPALVTGSNAAGGEFKEFTELISLSSQEAIFRLDSRVIIGSRLNISLEVPKTLFLENQLKVDISGNVKFAKAEPDDPKRQLIILRLNKNYKIKPVPFRKN